MVGGMLPAHRPKRKWRRYLLYIYCIMVFFLVHFFNLGRYTAMFFTSSSGFTSIFIVALSNSLTLLLVVSTSRRTKYIRPFLECYSSLYTNTNIPHDNYKPFFIKMSKWIAVWSIIVTFAEVINFMINIFITIDTNPMIEILITPLSKTDSTRKYVSFIFVVNIFISVVVYCGCCWLFISIIYIIYKEYVCINNQIKDYVRENTIKEHIEEVRLHHERLNEMLRNADDVICGMAGLFSLSVIALFCLAAYDIAVGTRNIYILTTLFLSLVTVLLIYSVIFSGCILINDQVSYTL